MQDDDWKLITPLEYRLWEDQSWGGGPNKPWPKRHNGNISLMAITRDRKRLSAKRQRALKELHGDNVGR